LLELGFARGSYAASPDDGLELVDCRITNAVRCVPPQNKPDTREIATCRGFLSATIGSSSALTAILALGRIAHDSTLVALDCRRSSYVFAHGACHRIAHAGGSVALYDSYHCSRYNTNTGRLTPDMFRAVLAAIKARLDASH
jgi:uracil-DNA glycosylase family 4